LQASGVDGEGEFAVAGGEGVVHVELVEDDVVAGDEGVAIDGGGEGLKGRLGQKGRKDEGSCDVPPGGFHFQYLMELELFGCRGVAATPACATWCDRARLAFSFNRLRGVLKRGNIEH
jgi:hypothetical protein